MNSVDLENYAPRAESRRPRRPANPAFVSAREAAELTGVSAKTVRRWIAANRLRAVKNGRSFRISLSELEDVYGRPIVAQTAPQLAEEALPPTSMVSRFATGAPESVPPASQPTEANHLARLVRDLITELVEASARTAALRQQCETLTAQLEEAQEAARDAQRQPRRVAKR